MAENQDSRLNRIEEKIDKLSDAMISLARAEEKLIQIEKSNHAAYERMNRFSQKIDDLEGIVTKNNQTITVINKLFWAVMVTAIGVIASQIWMH